MCSSQLEHRDKDSFIFLLTGNQSIKRHPGFVDTDRFSPGGDSISAIKRLGLAIRVIGGIISCAVWFLIGFTAYDHRRLAVFKELNLSKPIHPREEYYSTFGQYFKQM
jgi:hypothetical protein